MWSNPQFPADLVTFTEKILNGKRDFLFSVTVFISVSVFIKEIGLNVFYYNFQPIYLHSKHEETNNWVLKVPEGKNFLP